MVSEKIVLKGTEEEVANAIKEFMQNEYKFESYTYLDSSTFGGTKIVTFKSNTFCDHFLLQEDVETGKYTCSVA